MGDMNELPWPVVLVLGILTDSGMTAVVHPLVAVSGNNTVSNYIQLLIYNYNVDLLTQCCHRKCYTIIMIMIIIIINNYNADLLTQSCQSTCLMMMMMMMLMTMDDDDR